MSKTVATCIAETNLIQGEPQENVFFLTLSRKIEDFPNEFLRTARSTSPIQICAIFSTIGPDNLSAVLNLELNAELERIASACANQAVLDFDGFANTVINNLNVKVCNFAANKGTQFKTSMSMFVIEGDILRVIHVGITKAVLFRNNRIMLLTEEQTVAHRYVQMGAIQPSEELTHPENMNLTQYLGKMPQEGPVNADKKVHLKLQDNDELFLMGVGLSRRLPSQMRNSIIAKPLTTEVKAKEIINAAVSYGIKSGLTLIDMKVESTFLLPGDAVINSNLRTEAGLSRRDNQKAAESNAFTDFENDKDLDYDSDSSDTINYVPGSAVASYAESDEEELIVNESKERVKTIIIPLIIFIVCILLGFGVTFMIFNMKDLINFGDSTTTTLPVGVGSVLYANENMVPVYSKASEEATVIGTLNLGDPVTLKEITNEAFSKILTANNVTGYVASDKLTAENPITGTSEFDPFGDATSVTTGEVTLPDGETVQTTGVKKDNIYYPPTATPKPTLESIGTDEFGNPIYPTPTPDPNKPTPTPDPNKPTPTTAPATPTPGGNDNPTEAPKPTDNPTEAPKPTEKPTEAPKPTEKPTEAPKPTDPPPPPKPTDPPANGG
ncbi:MAG: SH3 domain-containing protein, partial [Clostridiales bacterium]|nr:SH3 domain-containing protein [Clostridiales bacterium]